MKARPTPVGQPTLVPPPSAGPSGNATDPIRGAEAVIVLPTLDEEDGLEPTFRGIAFREMRDAGWDVRPLVIDGGSTDGTVPTAHRLGIPLLRQSGRGKGAAVREVLQWLRERGVRLAVVMDADRSYSGSACGPALSLLSAGHHLVIGVRRPLQSRPENAREMIHRVGNAFLNYAASQEGRHPILDLCSGFWAVDLRAELDRDLVSKGFEVEAEMFLKAYRAGLKVAQIPIGFQNRVGQAKLRAFRDGGRIFGTILRSASRPMRGPTLPSATGGTAELACEILSICFIHGTNQVFLRADPSRAREATDLAAELRRHHIGSLMSIVTEVSERGLSAGEPGHWTSPDRITTVVTFPPAEPPTPESARPVLVELPDTSRVVYLGGRGRRAAAGDRPLSWPGALVAIPTGHDGLTLEYRDRRRTALSPVRDLGQVLNWSPRRKELSLLRASIVGPPLFIWSLKASDPRVAAGLARGRRGPESDPASAGE
ncbi:MAG: glycosyltransferase family 2 protein [Thermoplasmata archaeon]|nr:glycosyltransferase family 2 protein [Thermoplasmata archaeon]